MYQNPFYLFIKMLDEIKRNCPQKIQNVPQKKHFLAQSSTLVVCFHPFNIFGKDKFFQITVKHDKNALLSFLVCAYKFLNQLLHANERIHSVLLQSSHFTRPM
jgi:hypothetical protein